MKKLTEKKINSLNEIKDLISNSISTTIIDYSKITSLDLKYLRKALHKRNFKAKVLKNTLIKKVLKEKNIHELNQYLTGQNLIIFSENQISEPIKIIKDFNKKNDKFKIKAAYVYNKIFINDGIQKIINLESKEDELISLINTLRMPIVKFNSLLKIITEKLEGEKNDNN